MKEDNLYETETWLKRARIQMDKRQQLNGNNSRKLLKKIDILSEISPGNIFL